METKAKYEKGQWVEYWCVSTANKKRRMRGCISRVEVYRPDTIYYDISRNKQTFRWIEEIHIIGLYKENA